VDPEQLEEVAGELWSDAGLRELEPVQAAQKWLKPLGRPTNPGNTHSIQVDA
jgi:hypothetical protein